MVLALMSQSNKHFRNFFLPRMYRIPLPESCWFRMRNGALVLFFFCGLLCFVVFFWAFEMGGLWALFGVGGGLVFRRLD